MTNTCERVTSGTAKKILHEQVFKDTAIITDQSAIYPRATKDYAGHATVNHSIHEYARCIKMLKAIEYERWIEGKD